MVQIFLEAEVSDGLLPKLSNLLAEAEILRQKSAPKRHVFAEAGDATAHPGDKAGYRRHQADYARLEVAALALRVADLGGQQDQLPDEQDYE